jgi:hypothetical protein
VVDPILENHPKAHRYATGSWGPKQADILIAEHGGIWHNPALLAGQARKGVSKREKSCNSE